MHLITQDNQIMSDHSHSSKYNQSSCNGSEVESQFFKNFYFMPN